MKLDINTLHWLTIAFRAKSSMLDVLYTQPRAQREVLRTHALGALISSKVALSPNYSQHDSSFLQGIVCLSRDCI